MVSILVLDNHAAFEDVMQIISKPMAETAPRKPWTLLKNGDLLERVHFYSQAKNRASIIGSWGRGHSTEDAVKAGKV